MRDPATGLEPTKLEEIGLEKLLANYELLTVPDHVPAVDFGRTVLRQAYVGGFGAAITLARRLDREPAERRAEILERFESEVWGWAKTHGGGGPTS